jgi:hypothetical protein
LAAGISTARKAIDFSSNLPFYAPLARAEGKDDDLVSALAIELKRPPGDNHMRTLDHNIRAAWPAGLFMQPVRKTQV